MWKQTVIVNTVTAELGALNDVVRSVSEEGYSTIASLGLPETIACTYQAGVPVNSEDREVAISWKTEIPENLVRQRPKHRLCLKVVLLYQNGQHLQVMLFLLMSALVTG
mgnify:CR=1 FL=1